MKSKRKGPACPYCGFHGVDLDLFLGHVEGVRQCRVCGGIWEGADIPIIPPTLSGRVNALRWSFRELRDAILELFGL